jgi:hypothetical protein
METLWSTFWTCSTIGGSDLDNALRFGITGQLGLTSVSAYVEYEPENVPLLPKRQRELEGVHTTEARKVNG